MSYWKTILYAIAGAVCIIGAIWFAVTDIRWMDYETAQSLAMESVATTTPQAPVMDRIAKCESSDRQFGTDGQVLVHINKNGSYDMGVYQINSIQNALATKLGYNLSTEKGNRAFAEYIYQNEGTGAWSSSENCWNK